MREHIQNCGRVVVKVGTTTLAYPNGKLNLQRIEKLTWVLSALRNRGLDVVLVTSGAIAVGADRLGLAERPRDICGKQAASAVGQAALMQMYQSFFLSYGQTVAQILLTKDVLENEVMRENARNTFFTLFKLGVIPIVNENDTVSVAELGFSFGENDLLSAYVACLVESDALALLSDTNAIYDLGDPALHPEAKAVSFVSEITPEIKRMAGGSGSKLGTGGMASKVEAAEMVTAQGIDMVVCSGKEPEILFDVLDGKEIGTFFLGRR